MKAAQTAGKDIDISTDVKGYKQAVDSLSASISACVGTDLLPEAADVVVAARDLQGMMNAKLKEMIDKVKQKLLAAISKAEKTREWAPLAVHVDRLVADEVLRESCADAVESAKNVLAIIRAAENERIAVVKVCKILIRVS